MISTKMHTFLLNRLRILQFTHYILEHQQTKYTTGKICRICSVYCIIIKNTNILLQMEIIV